MTEGSCARGQGCECDDRNYQPSKYLTLEIDREKVVGFNEKEKGSSKRVFKEYNDRHSKEAVGSLRGVHLAIRVPFLSKVNITQLNIKGNSKLVHLYKNNNYIDAKSALSSSKTESLTLPQTEHIVPVPLKAFKFKDVSTLSLFVEEAYAPSTEISYIGIKGVVSGRLPTAVETTYEVFPSKSKLEEMAQKAPNLKKT